MSLLPAHVSLEMIKGRCELDMDIVIRNEIKSDIKAISEITKAAFETLPISNHTEQFIIDALRDANALTISLVAVAGKKVVGHIAFSPVTVSDGSPGWYGLGPISVLPELQKQGIGKSLIREGLSSLKTLGAKGCVLVGDPGYYERFGFRSLPDLIIDDVPQENVLALPFEESKTSGTVVFHDGFAANG
jgi:putative acetyltransferase